MKRTTKKLTKRQRKVRSARKTWTKAEAFQLRNERSMREYDRALKQLAKLQRQLEEQAAVKETIDAVPIEPLGVVEEAPTELLLPAETP
jgi:hypothetical protein